MILNDNIKGKKIGGFIIETNWNVGFLFTMI